jgi:DNA-binding NarL/FixJ family response regulator
MIDDHRVGRDEGRLQAPRGVAGDKGLHVVLADAQSAFRAGVRLALEDHGFAIVGEANSARDAVDAVVRERPDICLIDVAVPGNAILAVCQMSVRAPETSVVMLSLTADSAEVFASLRAGAVGYLEKTIDPARLPRVLAAVAKGEAALPRAFTARLIEGFHGRSKRRRHSMMRRWRVILTDRQWEVADLLCADLTTAQIADRLGLAEVTVRRHISQITRTLGAGDRGAARKLLSASGQQA